MAAITPSISEIGISSIIVISASTTVFRIRPLDRTQIDDGVAPGATATIELPKSPCRPT